MHRSSSLKHRCTMRSLFSSSNFFSSIHSEAFSSSSTVFQNQAPSQSLTIIGNAFWAFPFSFLSFFFFFFLFYKQAIVGVNKKTTSELHSGSNLKVIFIWCCNFSSCCWCWMLLYCFVPKKFCFFRKTSSTLFFDFQCVSYFLPPVPIRKITIVSRLYLLTLFWRSKKIYILFVSEDASFLFLQ